jgi:salicylate hydroxylase
MAERKPLEVAIIGGGITGVTLALGLLRRHVKFTIYERASSFREIGAGIGFTPNAERAMKILDGQIHQCFRKVAVQNGDDWFRYVDGYNHNRHDPEDTSERLMFKMYLGERGFEGCRRSDFLQGLVDLLPTEYIKFEKNLEYIEDVANGDRVTMRFRDGSSEQADVGKSMPYTWVECGNLRGN